MMSFKQDDGHRESEQYCSYCFQDGKIVGEELSLEEFKKVCYEGMRKKGIGPIKARFYSSMIGFAPYWKNKKA
tara:strand:+ start:1338 stop:1556 length:219 start_codon:yes stop_codon:yes gene_type:complete